MHWAPSRPVGDSAAILLLFCYMKLILLPFCSLFCYKKPIILSCCALFCCMKPIVLPFCSVFCYMKPIVRGGGDTSTFLFRHGTSFSIFVVSNIRGAHGMWETNGAHGMWETKWGLGAPRPWWSGRRPVRETHQGGWGWIVCLSELREPQLVQ